MKKKIELMAQLHNRFDIEVRDAATGELKQRARAFNVICDGLWDAIITAYSSSSGGYFNGSAYFKYIHFGSGSGTPSASDTALFSSIGYKEVSPTLDSDYPNGIISASASITLQSTEAVGETFTEVGIGKDTTSVVTHALIEDMSGNPTSFTKTGTDVVIIYATIYLHFPPEGFSNSSIQPTKYYLDNNSPLFKYILGATNTNYNRLFVGVTAGKSTRIGTGDNGTRMTCQADRANKKWTMTVRLEATVANIPIKALLIKGYVGQSEPSWTSRGYSAILMIVPGGWFTPGAIVGEEVGTGDGATTDFSTAFPIRSNATVKVDGVAAQATVRTLGAEVADSAWSYINAVAGLSSAGTVLYTDAYGLEQNVPMCLENPYYAVGLASFIIRAQSSGAHVDIYASDDMETWELVVEDQYFPNNTYSTFEIPAAYQNKRFFKFIRTNSSGGGSLYFTEFTCNGHPGNIHFDTPPAAGSVITVDYVPDCIAKDSDHVFDLTVELTFGEYTPPT